MVRLRERLARTGSRLVALDLVLLVAAAALVFAAARAGNEGRRALARSAIVRVRSPEQALRIWREAGVRGRVLVHFARDIAMVPDAGPPSSRNYLARALDEGLIRSVVHVIPDDAWGEVQARLAARPDVERREETFRLRKAGTPILVLRRADLPHIREPALVTIEGDRWSPEALRAIAGFLDAGLAADIVVWNASAPDRGAVLRGALASQ